MVMTLLRRWDPCLIGTAFLAAMILSGAAAAQDVPRADPERMLARIEALSAFGRNADGGVDRVAYSEADLAARAHVMALMRDLGLTVRTDTAGNMFGHRDGSEPELPALLFGSHIDSVPGGGNYDGPAGVFAALEAITLLNEAGHTTRHPLEVVVFADEEGGLIGSLAMAGKLKPAALQVQSHAGISVAEGIRRLGGDPDRLQDARIDPADYKAFIELHIEQGAILEESNTDIGVVEGIVGIRWWDVVIEGMANHAGTTPMDRRRDAMVAAADLTLAINQVAVQTPGRQVATVGRIQAFPGAPNVIPGRVVMSLEVRDLDRTKIEAVFQAIKAKVPAIETARGVSVRFDALEVASEPAPTDPRMRQIIADAAKDMGLSRRFMPSGAGHDAQDMVPLMPTGMIFVPSRAGISHSPDEFTAPEDLANGADVLLRALLALDGGALEQAASDD
ncbi:MAG: Zn-dependent hydrolase [Rhodothalassiaceae bacterium]